MIYTWLCNKCEHRMEVERSMANIDVGPDECEKCNQADFKRVITAKKGLKGFQLNGGGWHSDNYFKTRPK